MVDGDKYRFKPVLNVHDRKGLVKLLSNNDIQGLSGVLVEEVEESVPHASKALRVNVAASSSDGKNQFARLNRSY